MQRPVSRTNQNLFLEPSDFDERGTYGMGTFLGTRNECREEHREGCPMVLASETWMDDDYPRSRTWPVEPPDPSKCPGLVTLKGYCGGSRAQRTFFRHYCRTAPIEPISEMEWQGMVEYSGAVADFDEAVLRRRLTYPALIPEVWLNVIPPGNRTLAEEKHLSRNPQRVDFLMLARGRKCVIEIDGPSHYADYDEETRTYAISERRYTLNLRIERSLREQGFEIYRFSNLEVEETPIEAFPELISELSGF
jgi:hypothetical protein